MERRDLFKIIGAGALTSQANAFQHAHTASAGSAGFPAALRFFTPEQNAMVSRLCDIIIPPDEVSAGAAEAGVSHYIDLMLHYGPKDGQADWPGWLKAVDKRASAQFGKPFKDCSRDQHELLVAEMAEMAEKETDSHDPFGRFFARLKSLTIAGFHYSPVGLQQDMKYRGNTAVANFPGCTHKEHQS